MAKRYDVCAPRAGKDDKTFWHRVGTAFEGEKGISVKLDSLPLSDAKGEVWLKLFEPRPKQDQQQERVPGSAKTPVDLADDIPF